MNTNNQKNNDRDKALNKDYAFKSASCFKLAEHIALRSGEDIASLRSLLGTDDVAQWLSDAGNLKSVLLALPHADFELFRRAASEVFINDDGVQLPLHTGAIMFCLFTAFDTENGVYIVVPTELRSLWRDIERGGFTEYKRQRDELDAFAVASAKLYGVIPLTELCEIYSLRSSDGKKLSVQQAIKLLDGLDDGRLYLIENGLLLHPTAREQYAEDYMRLRKGIERYLPDTEKLMHYGDGDYYDVFRELELYRLSVEKNIGEEKALMMTDCLYMLLAAELYAPFIRSDFFKHFGLDEPSGLADRLKPKVRQWRLYGHTAEEL